MDANKKAEYFGNGHSESGSVFDMTGSHCRCLHYIPTASSKYGTTVNATCHSCPNKGGVTSTVSMVELGKHEKRKDNIRRFVIPWQSRFISSFLFVEDSS